MWQLVTSVTSSHLFQTLATSMGVQWVGWAVASYFHTEKFYDLAGSLTFILLSHMSHGQSKMTTRQSLHSWMIFAWACRLGTFLFMRVLKDGSDRRFDKVRDSPGTFLIWWSVQGVWVWMTLLPTILLNTIKRDVPLGNRDYLGYGLWVTGFLFEVVADMQKSIFRANPDNNGKFISSGLWAISRHPNYFGEILLWFGLYISSTSVFRGTQYMTVISPVFIYFLLTRVSGVPLLEKSGLKRWGHLPEYKQYLENVPVLFPFFKT